MNGAPVFLKLGGSLITVKDKPSTARLEGIRRASGEIAASRWANPGLQLLLGHGSGSFGHFPAKEHGTRDGVHTPEQWRGFGEVWRQAAALNSIVMEALQDVGVPTMAFPPSAGALAQDGQIERWELQPILAALRSGLVPVVYGDVAFDLARGGTVLSTEDLFKYLAAAFKPARILLAGDEEGVLANYGTNPQLIPEITPVTYAMVSASIRGPVAPDVTGGMAGKVESMLALVQQLPDCEVCIFSGLLPGNIEKALSGSSLGTRLYAN
ncbi:MAG TPA: isopentenyl phosphate kinase [Anaerolineales bacterium]|nr:isopentenyl phosphate kinase [Anaerolineales bacterium]